MVILVVHVNGVATIEREGHSPVPAYFHSPSAATLTLQRMQAQSWQPHISWLNRYMEATQDESQPNRVLGLDTAARSGREEPLQSFVSEAPDRHETACNP
jgi:hypothetical protein